MHHERICLFQHMPWLCPTLHSSAGELEWIQGACCTQAGKTSVWMCMSWKTQGPLHRTAG